MQETGTVKAMKSWKLNTGLMHNFDGGIKKYLLFIDEEFAWNA
jgi:hypothetical protein